jgi:hypothetical protein
MDIAVAGAAVRLALEPDGSCCAALVAIGAVAPTAISVPEAEAALLGSRIDPDALERMALAVRAAARPIDDKRGTVAYRRQVIGVLARRAAERAFERARERTETREPRDRTVRRRSSCGSASDPADACSNGSASQARRGLRRGDRGACSVLLDGRLVCACLVLAAEAEGRAVSTVGHRRASKLHPLQQQLLAHAGLQCASAPGHRVAAKALLDRNRPERARGALRARRQPVPLPLRQDRARRARRRRDSRGPGQSRFPPKGVMIRSSLLAPWRCSPPCSLRLWRPVRDQVTFRVRRPAGANDRSPRRSAWRRRPDAAARGAREPAHGRGARS